MRFTVLCLAAASVCIGSPTLHAQTSADDTAPVVTAVQRLFDAMAQHDTASLRALLVPGTRFVSTSVDAGADPTPRLQSDTAFITRLAARPNRLLERMWEPVVHVQGSIATLWAPYDFHVDGKFSHCGIDTVTLVRHAGTWRVAAIVYTTQRNGCPASPLGAPRS